MLEFLYDGNISRNLIYTFMAYPDFKKRVTVITIPSKKELYYRMGFWFLMSSILLMFFDNKTIVYCIGVAYGSIVTQLLTLIKKYHDRNR